MRKLALASAGLAGVIAAVWLARGHGHDAPVAPPAAPVTAPAPIAASSSRAPAPALAPAVSSHSDLAVTVAADKVVARVDGIAITGHDVVAFGGTSKGTLTMSQPMYDMLVQRAIDRELVLAKAKRDGVVLDDAREHQLELVRQNQAARTPDDPAQIEWEVRDAEGRLTTEALLAREGITATPAQQDVDAYYQAHRDEFGDMPRSSADLEIRQTLAGDMATRYQDRQREFLEQLRSAGQIVRADS